MYKSTWNNLIKLKKEIWGKQRWGSTFKNSYKHKNELTRIWIHWKVGLSIQDAVDELSAVPVHRIIGICGCYPGNRGTCGAGEDCYEQQLYGNQVQIPLHWDAVVLSQSEWSDLTQRGVDWFKCLEPTRLHCALTYFFFKSAFVKRTQSLKLKEAARCRFAVWSLSV